jgi:cellulose synthase/poly-beta-1,6-N-acetylglucosamine synthase-like glycosyltransferase
LKVSIVVTCRNNASTIGECLQALKNQTYPQDAVEILVLDACSTDGTLEIAKQYTNKTYSLAVNAAAAYNYAMNIASFDVLGFVDSDAKVEVDWLQKLTPHLSDPKVAGVSGAIETWNTDNPWAKAIGYELKSRYSRIGKYTGRIATMNLLMKKAVIAEAGGWDENFPSQYDTDLGYRVSALGYRFAYEPTAKCYHFNRPTLRAYWRQQLQYGKNTLKLYFKHGRLARGDEITDWGMNIQPALLLAVVGSLLLGIVPLLRPLWYASAALFCVMVVYYAYSAEKVHAKFKDASTSRLEVLFLVRVCAWFCGAVVTTVNFLFHGGKRR